MNSKQIQADIDFANNFIFLKEKKDYNSRLEAACIELKPIYSKDYNPHSKANQKSNQLLLDTSKKYNISFEKLKTIFYGMYR